MEDISKSAITRLPQHGIKRIMCLLLSYFSVILFGFDLCVSGCVPLGTRKQQAACQRPVRRCQAAQRE